MRNKKILILCESAVMLALAFALSYLRLWEMPQGGSITLASMLPIMLVSVKHGTRVGVSTAFLYSLTQLFQGFMNVTISWAMSGGVLVTAIFFDYLVPFTLLGFSGIFRKSGEYGIYFGMTLSVILRFICHFATGVSIWRQWTSDGWNTYIYSAAYNGGFLLPDFIIVLLVAVLILRVKQVRKLLNLNVSH